MCLAKKGLTLNYIYHLKPEPMEGDSLIPLNEMDKDSQLFKGHAKKYTGREELTEVDLPFLNCKWNDVVQFSALDPRVIVDELRKYQTDLVLSRRSFYKISVDQIVNKYEAIIFDRDPTRGKGSSFEVLPHEVKLFNHENYTEQTEVPIKTIECWKRAKEEGGKFLFFPFVTHIMVKGKIDTGEFDLVNF